MTPKFRQVADHIAARIRAGEFKANDPLRSIKQTAVEYSMSYVSIQKAYKLLESRGIIYTRNGTGSFVRQNAFRRENVRTANLIFLHASTDLFAFEFLCTALLELKHCNIVANVIYLEITSLSDLATKVETADINFVLTPSTAFANQDILRILQSHHEKVVCFNNCPESRDLHRAIPDDEGILNVAIDHLKFHGHQQLLFASIEYTSGAYTWHSYRAKIRSWRAFTRSAYPHAADGSHLFLTPSRDPERIALELRARLQQDSRITALICESTELCKALRVLTNKGDLTIPEDISVIMLGDTQLNIYGSPPFTAISSNFKGFIHAGIEIIDCHTASPGPVCKSLIPFLIERESVKQLEAVSKTRALTQTGVRQ